MGALVMAWLIGEGILIYRTYKVHKAPPGPGQLLYTSGIFVLLALLAESEKARSIAITLAWGFDIAAFFKLFDGTILEEAVGTGAIAGVTGQIPMWPPPKLPDTVIFPLPKTAAANPTPPASTPSPTPATPTGRDAPRQT